QISERASRGQVALKYMNAGDAQNANQKREWHGVCIGGQQFTCRIEPPGGESRKSLNFAPAFDLTRSQCASFWTSAICNCAQLFAPRWVSYT
ncbi:MAG: hypothetical protein ACRD52_16370, partial [Candidatus Acidiferrales bacterium]